MLCAPQLFGYSFIVQARCEVDIMLLSPSCCIISRCSDAADKKPLAVFCLPVPYRQVAAVGIEVDGGKKLLDHRRIYHLVSCNDLRVSSTRASRSRSARLASRSFSTSPRRTKGLRVLG